MPRPLPAVRLRPRWPLAALLGGSVLAAALAAAPSRAEALTTSGVCAPVGVVLCYKPEVEWGPAGPQLNLFFTPLAAALLWEQ